MRRLDGNPQSKIFDFPGWYMIFSERVNNGPDYTEIWRNFGR